MTYLTLMAGSCVHPRPKALVSFYGYPDGLLLQGEPRGLKHPRVAEAFEAVLAFLQAHVGCQASRSSDRLQIGGRLV